MSFTIEELRKPVDGGFYTSPARICLTEGGELCDETDERAVRLLVGAGCDIPTDEARKYGLIVEDEAPLTKKGRKGLEDKALDA